jgi:hypothetical protein
MLSHKFMIDPEYPKLFQNLQNSHSINSLQKLEKTADLEKFVDALNYQFGSEVYIIEAGSQAKS